MQEITQGAGNWFCGGGFSTGYGRGGGLGPPRRLGVCYCYYWVVRWGAEPLAGSSARAGGGWLVWPCGLPNTDWTAGYLCRLCPTRFAGRQRTLNWLLAPVGMVAMPAGWPSPATGVDRPSSQPINSSSCREGVAVWRRLGFAVFRCSGWGIRVPGPVPRG